VGRSPKIREIAHKVERVARTDIPVLITGESGTGKEVVARLIHFHSPRKRRPFRTVSCATIPRELLESELFGYEKGFMGAYDSKPGVFELADTGTIFLDEINQMDLRLQSKLLQVLQEQQFSRLGAEREISVNVRFISSTSESVEKHLAEGLLREDFYYRLNVLEIRIPPLRERKEDIPDLVNHFCQKLSSVDGHPREFRVSDDLVDAFVCYDWPGNVRELEKAVLKLRVLGNESVVWEDLVDNLGESADLPEPELEDLDEVAPLKEVARLAARQAEQEMILRALRRTQWNRKRAAELLKISYKSLLYKLKEADLAKRALRASLH
jgi:two-component system response regulator AtoC